MPNNNLDVYVSVMHKYYNFSPHHAPWEFHINVESRNVADI